MYTDDICEDRAGATGALAATPVEQKARGGRWPDSLRAILMGRIGRSEVPARRYWLRFLDAPLTSEIRAAGALDVDELVDAIPRILRCDEGRVSRETIQEWWEFAMRRRWLERVGSLWGLTERAENDLRAEHERANSPDPRRMAGSVARWMISSLIGAVGLASGRYLVPGAAILAVAGTIIVSLLLAGAVTRAIEPSLDRWLARRACDWLQGRPIWPARGTNRSQAEFSRLYQLARIVQ